MERIRVTAVAGEQLRCLCPFHDDTSPSLSINIELNKAICFAGCYSGSFSGLMVKLNGLYPSKIEDAFEFDHGSGNGLLFSLHSIDYDWKQDGNEYLLNRGFTENTIKKWQLWYNRYEIAIPVRGLDGKICGFVYRTIVNQEPKYLHPGIDKSKTLFNLWRMKGEEVNLTEGPLDCIWMWQSGIKNTVALLGNPTDDQIKLLGERFKVVNLYLDNDEAGERYVRKIGYRLVNNKIQVNVALLPENVKDVQELTKEEIFDLILVPYYAVVKPSMSGTLEQEVEFKNVRSRRFRQHQETVRGAGKDSGNPEVKHG